MATKIASPATTFHNETLYIYPYLYKYTHLVAVPQNLWLSVVTIGESEYVSIFSVSPFDMGMVQEYSLLGYQYIVADHQVSCELVSIFIKYI